MPRGKDEYILFVSLFILYFICSYNFILNTSIIDSIEIDVDTYFSFDTPSFFHNGYQSLTPHPLIRFFTEPVIFTSNILAKIFNNYKIKTLFIAICTNILVSLSITYTYKYLLEIIKLKKNLALLICIVYSFFATNLVLSFTIESFTFSLFFLSFYIYFCSSYIKKNEPIPLFPSIIFILCIGGITITNVIIAILPIILSNDHITNKLKKIATPCVLLIIILIYIQFKYDFIQDILIRLRAFRPKEYSFFNLIFLYVGSPMLFPEINKMKINIVSKDFYILIFDIYKYIWQYFVIIGIYILSLYSAIRGYRNKNIILAISIIIYNIFIHVVIKYGFSASFIYGGHWTYIIPILIGWTFFYLKGKIKNLFIALFIFFSIILITNNIFELNKFIDLAKKIFPAY